MLSFDVWMILLCIEVYLEVMEYPGAEYEILREMSQLGAGGGLQIPEIAPVA